MKTQFIQPFLMLLCAVVLIAATASAQKKDSLLINSKLKPQVVTDPLQKLEIPVKVFFAKPDSNQQITVSVDAELISTCEEYKKQWDKDLLRDTTFAFKNSASHKDTLNGKSVEQKIPLFLGKSKSDQDCPVLVKLTFAATLNGDNKPTIVERTLLVEWGKPVTKPDLTYNYEFIFKNHAILANLCEKEASRDSEILLVRKNDTAQNDSSRFTIQSLKNTAVLSARFISQLNALFSTLTKEDSVLAKEEALKFQIYVQEQKLIEESKKIQASFEKGVKSAIDAIEDEKAKPAGIMTYRKEVQVYRYEPAFFNENKCDSQACTVPVGTFKVQSVHIEVREGILEEVQVLGKLILDQSSLSEDEEKELTEKMKSFEMDSLVFRNQQYGIALERLDRHAQYANYSIPELDKKIRINLNDVLCYIPEKNSVMRMKARNAEFGLSKDKPSKQLEQHRFTDYARASVFSDVLGLNSDEPNSLFQTQIGLDFPINVRNIRWYTLIPSLESEITLARINNKEPFTHVRKTNAIDGVAQSTLQDYVNIFDQLEYFNTFGFIKAGILDVELKSLDTRIKVKAGSNVWRTGIEFDNRGGKDSVSNIYAYSLVGEIGFDISPAKHVGLYLAYQYNWTHTQKLQSITYTSSARPAFRDQASDNIRLLKKFHLGILELSGYYEFDSGSRLFTRIRAFDSYDDRNVYMQVMLGYSIPLSSVKF